MTEFDAYGGCVIDASAQGHEELARRTIRLALNHGWTPDPYQVTAEELSGESLMLTDASIDAEEWLNDVDEDGAWWVEDGCLFRGPQ